MWVFVLLFLLVALWKSDRYGYGPLILCVVLFPIGAMWVVLILLADHWQSGVDDKGRKP